MTINISEELPARKNAPAVAAKSSAKKGDAKGGTPQENSAKRVRQAVYDIRYRARREDIDLRKAYSEYMANSNLSPQEKTAVREKLFGKQGGGVSEQYMVTSVDWAEKNFADAYHKVFVEGIKKEEPAIELAYEQELAEEPERKYKVRVFDPKSEKSYVRFATREKISRLRAKGLKVEMTEHGEAYEGERKKGEQTAAAMGGGPKKKEVKEAKLDPVGQEDADIDNDGDTDKTDKYLHNRRKAIGKAIAKKKGKKVDEAFLVDGATGTTSTEGQNAREIDVLPDKVAKKLQQVTVMPQDGTNPQVGKAPLMMSQEMEGEQLDELKVVPRRTNATLGSGEVKVRPPKLPSMKNPIMKRRRPDGSPAPIGNMHKLSEEEEDRRERYAFMNVARNLVRAKTGAKRPIAMDPEGTYKKAKEDLAKMVNSGNPDKDKEETACEEKAIDEGVASVLKTAAKIAGAAGGALAAGKALEKATSSKEPTRDQKDAADAKKHLDHYGKTGKMIRKEGKQLSMADTFKQIVETQKVDEGLQDTVDKVTKAAQSGLEKLGVPINRTPRGTATKADQDKKIEKNVK